MRRRCWGIRLTTLWRVLLLGIVALLAGLVAPGRALAQDGDPMCPYAGRCRTDSNRFKAPSWYSPCELGCGLSMATPAPHGDLTRATFYSFRDGNYEVYIARGDGTQAVNLTHHPAADLDAAIAPGGAQVAFVSDRDRPGRSFNLYVVNADGSGLRRLVAENSNQARPVFAPDGRRIYFAMRRDNNTDIYSVAVDGSDLRRLTTDPAADFDVAVLPDGSGIFWVRKVSDSDGRLMRANPDGSHAVFFGDTMRLLQHPVASPSGMELAVQADLVVNPNGPDGWLDATLVPLDGPITASPSFETNWLDHDVEITGWLPLLLPNLPCGYSTRSYYLSVADWGGRDHGGYRWLQKVNTTREGFDAGTNPVQTSLLDFGFSVTALDQTPPNTVITPPPPIYDTLNGSGLWVTAHDEGGAHTACVQNRLLDAQGALLFANDARMWSGERVQISGGQGAGWLILRAVDWAGNVGPWTRPLAYAGGVTALLTTLTDARGLPVSDITLSYLPYHLIDAGLPTNRWGQGHAWYLGSAGAAVVEALHPAFGYAAQSPLDPVWDAREPDVYLTRIYFRNGGYNVGAQAWRLAGAACLSEPLSNIRYTLWLGVASNIVPCGHFSPEYDPGGSASLLVRGEDTAALHSPTLAFFYQLTSFPGPVPSAPTAVLANQPVGPLRVLVTETTAAGTPITTTALLQTTPVFTATSVQQQPTLGWADLTPWQGRTITVTFALPSETSDPYASASIYSVSLGAWQTPVPRAAATPNAGAAAQPPTLVIDGDNFIGTPSLQIVGTSWPTQTLALAQPATTTRLVATLPKALITGYYRVRVMNPTGTYGDLYFSVNLPESCYLPVLRRWEGQ